MKPSISASTEHTDTLIHCEAPSVITGAHFYLYNNRSSAHIKETPAGEQERTVTFTVPHSSESTLMYCCSYQYKSINSELSDCIEAVEPTGESTDWPMIVGIILPVLILLGVTAAFLFWKCKKSGSNRPSVSPTTGTEKAACEVPNEGASSDPTTTSDLMYATVSHLPSHPSAFQPQEDSVVYSCLKTN
ncbi:hypothetical protein AGOR_G00207960 [Albula goreensis]|uniref:C19orf38 Ig domain-containing protein n=1 Tax=Albula goreensis TaxID=1534307 RepID=A0A8T3CRF3_9TELE|nr:hypothetical protein AGOR_G00207960 [Albula goreensis]